MISDRALTIAQHQRTSGCLMTLRWWRSAWVCQALSPQSGAALPGLCCAAAPWLPAAPGSLSLTSEWPGRQRDALTEAESGQSPVYQTSWSPGRHSLLTPIHLHSPLCPSPRLQDWSQLLGGKVCSVSGWSRSTSVRTDGGNRRKPADCWQQLWLLLLCDEVFWDVSWNKH